MPYQMKNGKWRAKKMIEGVVKTRVFPTKTEAKKWEAAQSQELWEAPTPTPTICLIDFCTAYLKMIEEQYPKRTFNEKTLACKRVLQILPPAKAVMDMTVNDCMEVLRHVARECGGNVANKCRKNMAAAWEWGKRLYGLPPVNPFKEADKFAYDKKPRYVPPEADFWKVYEVAQEQDKVFLLFLLHTGARRTEAFRLDWADVDFERQQIRLGTRKTASRGMEYAWVPMTTELMHALAQIRGMRVAGPVFVNPATGEPFTERMHLMGNLCKRAGVKHFGFHAIRHLAATIMAHAGLDLPSVQTVLRHQSPNTTARYIRSLGVQANKLDEVFGEKKKGAKVMAFAPGKKAIGT